MHSWHSQLYNHITGSAFALRCCKAHAKINRKMGNSTPCKIVTLEYLNMKLCMHDYVVDITHHAHFGWIWFSGDFSPNRWNITLLWLFQSFLTVLLFFDPTYRSNRWADFHAEWLKRRVSRQGQSFWGLEQLMTSFGVNMPPNPPWIGNFQPNSKNLLTSILSKLLNRFKPNFAQW